MIYTYWSLVSVIALLSCTEYRLSILDDVGRFCYQVDSPDWIVSKSSSDLHVYGNVGCVVGKTPEIDKLEYGNNIVCKTPFYSTSFVGVDVYDIQISLIDAVKQCDLRKVTSLLTLLLSSGASLDALDDDGFSALMRSIHCDAGIVLALLEGGADPNVRGFLGYTALMLGAADSGLDTGIIPILVEYGSDLELESERDGTPLMIASRWNNNPEILRTLIECGADVNASDNYGNTPLIMAAKRSRNPDVISVLLQSGASTSSRNVFGETAYICASIWNDNPEVSKVLRDSGISPVVEYYLWFIWDLKRYLREFMGRLKCYHFN